MKKIAVVSTEKAYSHLCQHCNLREDQNEIFFHARTKNDLLGIEISEVILAGNAEYDLGQYWVDDMLSIAMSRMR